MTRPRTGSALVVVLWVIGLLSLLIASMAFDAYLEGSIISFQRKRTKADYLARSGMEIANMLLAKSAAIPGGDAKGEEGDRWFEQAKRLKKGAIRGLVEKLGNGTITLEIVPEPARRNINNLDLQGNKNELEVEDNLERILAVGGVSEDMDLWPTLIDSFLDWVDPDSVARQTGAETDDYYATLKPPYKAENRPLDTVEELLLVKGFNRTILSGGTLRSSIEDEEGRPISGIADLLTTYGDGKVNINSASARVLMTLPGMDDLVAGAIVEEREGWVDEQGKRQDQPFQSPGDLAARIPGVDPRVSKYITTAESTICRITSVGEVQGVRRKVECIAEYSGGRLTLYRWWEGE